MDLFYVIRVIHDNVGGSFIVVLYRVIIVP
nr:MAG TPA: hypothetical protein [Caudoviricetes sp.]